MTLLHVANGHCTTGLIELSGVPGRTAIWADPLNESLLQRDAPALPFLARAGASSRGLPVRHRRPVTHRAAPAAGGR